MTDQEKIQLRIEAAKAMGYEAVNIAAYDAETVTDVWKLVTPNGEYLPVENWFVDENSVWDMMTKVYPNPLDNDADCNALLVAILGHFSEQDRGFKLWPEIYQGKFYVHTELENNPVDGDFEESDFPSENPDRYAAFREAVTRACVAAWKAVED